MMTSYEMQKIQIPSIYSFFDIRTLNLDNPNFEWKIVIVEEWIRGEQGICGLLVERIAEINK